MKKKKAGTLARHALAGTAPCHAFILWGGPFWAGGERTEEGRRKEDKVSKSSKPMRGKGNEQHRRRMKIEA